MKQHYILILFSLLSVLISSGSQCSLKSTYIPASSLTTYTNKYHQWTVLNASPLLTTLIDQPSTSNLSAYLSSFTSDAVPIFAFAGAVGGILILSILRMCWIARKKKTNTMTKKTEKNIQCLGFIVTVLLLAVIGGTLAALLYNHDVMAEVDNSDCIMKQSLGNLIQGDNNSSWLGLTNLTNSTTSFFTSFQNNINSIGIYIDSQPAQNLFGNLTSNMIGTPFYQVKKNIDCIGLDYAISCPDPAQNQYTCLPYFAFQLCNNEMNFGAGNISQQFSATVNNYSINLQNMYFSLSDLNAQQRDVYDAFNDYLSNEESISNVSTSYQSEFVSMFKEVNSGFYAVQIILYIIYIVLIIYSFYYMVSFGLFHFKKNYQIIKGTKNAQFFYGVMSILILIIAGFQLIGSKTMTNYCTTLQIFQSQDTRSYKHQKYINAYKSCRQGSNVSVSYLILNNIFNQQFNQTVQAMKVFNSINFSQFYTVSTTIYNQVLDYAAYPQTVQLIAAIFSQNVTQPLTILNELNTYANYSSINSTQSCKVLKDYLIFNSYNCTPFLIQNGTNNQGNNSCIILSSNNSQTITNRNSLLQAQCDGNSYYLDTSNNLIAYSESLRTLVNNSLINLNIFAPYSEAYFNYTIGLSQYLNAPFMTQINSFIQPYSVFNNGLMCTYLMEQLDVMKNQLCYRLNPFVYFLASFNIGIGTVTFVVMIFMYFLQPRVMNLVMIEEEKMNRRMSGMNVRQSILQNIAPGILQENTRNSEVRNVGEEYELIETTQREQV